jgi:hypothetical protein
MPTGALSGPRGGAWTEAGKAGRPKAPERISPKHAAILVSRPTDQMPQSRPWVADQITDRLWVLKTGSVLNNRRIKARMFRAFRMAFFRSTIVHNCKRFDAKGFFA